MHPIIVEKISEVENQRREREVQAYQRMNLAEGSKTHRLSVTERFEAVMKRFRARILRRTPQRDKFEVSKVDVPETALDAPA